jgi:hypothetical protein
VELLLIKASLVVDNGPPSIEMWQTNLIEEARNYLEAAIAATKDIQEYQ